CRERAQAPVTAFNRFALHVFPSEVPFTGHLFVIVGFDCNLQWPQLRNDYTSGTSESVQLRRINDHLLSARVRCPAGPRKIHRRHRARISHLTTAVCWCTMPAL